MAYSSRVLTDAKQRYGQIEKKALAIVFQRYLLRLTISLSSLLQRKKRLTTEVAKAVPSVVEV